VVIPFEANAAAALPTGTVTFLFTDVEGSTRLWQESAESMAVALARHDELIEGLVAHHNGMVVRPRGEGDSRFAVFARASDAVTAACAIQIALIREPWPIPAGLRVRIGLHTGESNLRLHDYYGPAVNRCARLRDAAHGGQVLISTVTADLVREAFPTQVTLRDLGQHRLKDLEQPEHVWQVMHSELPADFPRLRLATRTIERRHDWGDAPKADDFIGRAHELATVRDWALKDHCRLIGILGIGGVGKTSIAAKLTQDIASGFHRVYWRSLRNTPPVSEWIAGAIAFLSDEQLVPPEGEAERLASLLQLLRERPCLLVLDNFETVLEPGQSEGRYRDGLAGYGAILRAVGETNHQSCLVITSREAPPDCTTGARGSVRTLDLSGLGVPEGQILLADRQLRGDQRDWSSLIARYAGNSLALKVVGESIRQIFGGDIGSFLAESSATVFGGIKRLLAEQVERSSPVERHVLSVLAIAREPVTIAQLIAEVSPHTGHSALLEAIEALCRRSLVEQTMIAGAAAFALQPAVLEFVTDRFVQDASNEVWSGQPRQQLLITAQARQFVCEEQERLIGTPILQQVRLPSGTGDLDVLLRALIEKWRKLSAAEQGYAPGNVVEPVETTAWRPARPGPGSAIGTSRLSRGSGRRLPRRKANSQRRCSPMHRTHQST
jgi:class 3 adenylate cyclase